MPFLPPNQQRQSTEGTVVVFSNSFVLLLINVFIVVSLRAVTLLVWLWGEHPAHK